MGGPGVAFECEARCGLHVNEDHFLVEVVDPDTGDPLPPGSKGELVLTSLREAMPLIGFRVRDITAYTSEMCSCGRTFGRIERVFARTDDMFVVNGVNVFPGQVESVITGIEGFEPHYMMIVVTKKGRLDKMLVRVEAERGAWEAGSDLVNRLRKKAGERIRSMVGVGAKVEVVGPGSITRSEGKAKRVEDRRRL